MSGTDVRLMAVAHLLSARFAPHGSVTSGDIEAAVLTVDTIDKRLADGPPTKQDAPLAKAPVGRGTPVRPFGAQGSNPSSRFAVPGPIPGGPPPLTAPAPIGQVPQKPAQPPAAVASEATSPTPEAEPTSGSDFQTRGL
jgi:hypothetical protein